MEIANAAGIGRNGNNRYSDHREYKVQRTINIKSHLHLLTNVLPRNQKLICQGKLLVDDMTLRSSEVMGLKSCLFVRKVYTKGYVPPVKREALASSKLKAVLENQKSGNQIRFLKDFEHWKASGVIALSDCLLEDIPDIVYAGRTFTIVLDLSHNFLQEVPFAINYFQTLQKLLLNGNDLGDDSINWEGLASLKSLTILSLSHNNLTILPSTLGLLTSLKQLDVANNKLTFLPIEIGLLPQFEMLMANNNSLCTIPTCIGNCISLVEVDISSNLLIKLPDAFANLHNLKVLTLSSNVCLNYLPKKHCLKCADSS